MTRQWIDLLDPLGSLPTAYDSSLSLSVRWYQESATVHLVQLTRDRGAKANYRTLWLAPAAPFVPTYDAAFRRLSDSIAEGYDRLHNGSIE